MENNSNNQPANSQPSNAGSSNGQTPLATPPAPPTPPTGEIAWQDKVKDKTPDQLVEMYGEAQKKIGELSAKDKQNDELIRQMNVILAAIDESDERKKLVTGWVEGWIDKSQGKKTEGKKELAENKPSEAVSDVRKQQENEIIRRFEQKYGIDRLDTEKKREMNGKVGNALWAVADPLGKFDKWEDLVAAIPVSKLENLLERAYYEANRGVIEKKMEESGEIAPPTMGSLPSSPLPPESEVRLTNEEREVAKKLGVSEEKYLERKKEKLAKK